MPSWRPLNATDRPDDMIFAYLVSRDSGAHPSPSILSFGEDRKMIVDGVSGSGCSSSMLCDVHFETAIDAREPYSQLYMRRPQQSIHVNATARICMFGRYAMIATVRFLSVSCSSWTQSESLEYTSRWRYRKDTVISFPSCSPE